LAETAEIDDVVAGIGDAVAVEIAVRLTEIHVEKKIVDLCGVGTTG
jgi:hypothetical protein